MKTSRTVKMLLASVIGLPLLAAAPLAGAHQMIALDEAGNLIRFSSKNPRVTQPLLVTGTSAKLVGIDVRPADRGLYGLAADGSIYKIEYGTGVARVASRARIGSITDPVIVDFNPVVDRLRVVLADGRSFHVNVDTGESVQDGPLFTATASPPVPRMVSAGGYTHSWPNNRAESTGFYRVDNANLRLIGREPAVSGTMVFTSDLSSPIALTGGTKDLRGGDIVTTPQGTSEAFVVKGARVYKISVPSGQIAMLGMVGEKESLDLVDVAVTEVE